MLKFAANALLCSAFLGLCAHIAEAGWFRCRSSCCAPAPTCAAPVATCAAPAGTAPVPAESTPPAPAAAGLNAVPAPVPGDSSVAGNASQTKRSYSYDPAPSGIVNYGTEATNEATPAPTNSGNPPTTKRRASNFFSAGRKAEGIRP